MHKPAMQKHRGNKSKKFPLANKRPIHSPKLHDSIIPTSALPQKPRKRKDRSTNANDRKRHRRLSRTTNTRHSLLVPKRKNATPLQCRHNPLRRRRLRRANHRRSTLKHSQLRTFDKQISTRIVNVVKPKRPALPQNSVTQRIRHIRSTPNSHKMRRHRTTTKRVRKLQKKRRQTLMHVPVPRRYQKNLRRSARGHKKRKTSTMLKQRHLRIDIQKSRKQSIPSHKARIHRNNKLLIRRTHRHNPHPSRRTGAWTHNRIDATRFVIGKFHRSAQSLG